MICKIVGCMQYCSDLFRPSFFSILGGFLWNFITGLSRSPLRASSPRQRNFDRSLQISRQPSQPERTKYPKLKSWIGVVPTNSLVALLLSPYLQFELRMPAQRTECGESPLYLQARRPAACVGN